MNAIRYIIGEEILTRNEIFEIRFCLIPGELKLRLRRAKKKEKIEEEGRGNASGKYFQLFQSTYRVSYLQRTHVPTREGNFF